MTYSVCACGHAHAVHDATPAGCWVCACTVFDPELRVSSGAPLLFDWAKDGDL